MLPVLPRTSQFHGANAKCETACTYIHDFWCTVVLVVWSVAGCSVVATAHSQLATDSDCGRFVLADATTHTAHHNHNT